MVMKTVVVEKNDLGEVVGLNEVKTLTIEQINAYKNEIFERRENAKKVSEEEKTSQFAKDYVRMVMLAKIHFNDFVEKGLCETTEDFELMFKEFVLGSAFDESKAPIMFLKIMERLK